MVNLDRYGGPHAWDVWCAEQEERESQMIAHAHCSDCGHFHTFDSGKAGIAKQFIRLGDLLEINPKDPTRHAASILSDALEACQRCCVTSVCVADGCEEADPDDSPLDLGCELFTPR